MKRTVIVTGACGALGRAYVHAFAATGYDVLVNDLGVTLDGTAEDSGKAETLAAEIRTAGGSAVASTASVTEEDGAASIVQAALDAFGRIDAVVNNAGFLRDRTLAKLAPADFDAVLTAHLRGTMLVTRAALPALRESGSGRLVHTASAAIFGSFGQTNYSAAKGGIVSFSRSLALEQARTGITSNVVAPFARSRMTDAMTATVDIDLRPELVAPLVVHLAGFDCDQTGETFAVGGGHIARIVLGITPGWHGPPGQPASQAEIAAAMDTILATGGTTFPSNGAEVVVPYLAGAPT